MGLIISYGSKHGPAPASTLHFSCTDLSNPFKVHRLRKLTGLDSEVRAYVLGSGGIDLVERIIERYQALNHGPMKDAITVAIGCKGGRHRSVVIAQEVAARLGVPVRHRDLGLSDSRLTSD